MTFNSTKHFFKKSLGQHFILNPQLHKKIASYALDLTNVHVIEIGPGAGGLSKAILQQQNLASLSMIERDEDLKNLLQEEIINHPDFCHKTQIIFADAMQIDYKQLIKSIIEKYSNKNKCDTTSHRIKIIANLPYNIATNLIFKWLEIMDESEYSIEMITVLIQKEVALRFLAKSGERDFGKPALAASIRSQITLGQHIGPKNFTPLPKVDSTVISFSRNLEYNHINFSSFLRLINACFANPRKTIFNNLKNYHNPSINNNIKWTEILSELQINENLRPNQLNLAQYISILNKIYA